MIIQLPPGHNNTPARFARVHRDSSYPIAIHKTRAKPNGFLPVLITLAVVFAVLAATKAIH